MLLPEHRQLLFAHLGDQLSLDLYRAAGGLFQPGQLVQQGGFTTAGGTQYTAHLPPLDGQVDIIQSDYLFIAGPVHLAEIFGLHHVLHILSPSRRKIIFH